MLDPVGARMRLDRAELAPNAREGICELKRHGVEVAVVSLTWLSAVEALAERLGAKAGLGTKLDPRDWRIHEHS